VAVISTSRSSPGDSNVANGRNLLARLNWNAVQLQATGKQNRTDG
jgi:hypothetical protein